uniref:Mediator of DNA damage checkpoint protein 1 n=1 Tax=Geotrypetes seraphini TaxID=260995 RepID=A0A6P8N916_GEOSA|nr:mediator of DNA damage checkpoint protein 1 isoform X2 [Geotrypetes seraphini]
MDQTQLLDWDEESLTCETLEGKDGNKEPVGRLHVFSNNYGPEKDFLIHCGENIIGRQTTCHIPIPASSISKRHAVIEAEAEGSHFIFDCGSLNRTRWRKSTLKPQVRYALEDGDLLLFADVACQYFILPQPNENGTCQADAARQGLSGSPHAKDSDSDDSLLVPGTQGGPARLLALEKTPAVGAVKMGYGGILAKDSDDDTEESDRSRSYPQQEERASQESTVSAEGRHVLNSSAVFTPTTSTIVPESDTEEGQENTTEKDQLEQQRGAARPEQRPQDLFHLDSDTDVEDEDVNSKHEQRPFRKGGPSTSQNNDVEEKGAEQPAAGLEKRRMLSSGLDSDTDTEGGETERSSLELGDSSDTDVEGERERRPGIGEGDSRHANTNQDSDTDMEGEGTERPGAGEGDSRQINTDQDSDTDEGIERPGGGEVGIRQTTEYQDSDTDMEGEGMHRPGAAEGYSRQVSTDQDSDTDEGIVGIRQATAHHQDSDTDVEEEGTEKLSTGKEDIRQTTADLDTGVEGEGMERLNTGKGGIGQIASDLTSDTNVKGDRTERLSTGEGCIRQIAADLDSDADVEEDGTERLSTENGSLRNATADLDNDTNMEGEGSRRLGTGGEGTIKLCAQQNSDTDVEGAGLKRLSTEEERIRQLCMLHDTDMEQELGIGVADHSTPVEQRHIQRRPGHRDAKTESEEETSTDDGSSFAMLDTQCYLNPASKIWEEEREACIEPFVLRPSVGLLSTSDCASSENTDELADDQLEVAETQPFCDNHDLCSISSKDRAEDIEVEPTQAFLQQGESEDVSQEETQPIALYLSLRAALEPQRHHCGLDPMNVLQRRAVSDNHANSTESEPLSSLEKGEKPRITAQPSALPLNISEEQTQAYAIEIAEENVTESSLHPEGEIPKESREMESAFDDETQTYDVSLAEEVQATETLKVCREEAESQEQEIAENLSETEQVSKDNTVTTLPKSSAATDNVTQLLTASTMNNHLRTAKLVDTLDGPDPKRERGEEKVNPEKARTFENTEQDFGNDATQEVVPLPPLEKDADRTREKEKVVKKGRKKEKTEKKCLKEEEKTTKATSDAAGIGESGAVQLPEEGRSSTPGPAEEDKGGTPQEKKRRNKGGLPGGYQRKQSKVQKEPASIPGDPGSTVDEAAAESNSGDKQETPVPSQVVEPRSKSTRSTRRKTAPITEAKETGQEHQPSPAPSRTTKRTKKAVSESMANKTPAELEAPILTRRTRSRVGLAGTEDVPKEVAARPKRSRKSAIVGKEEVKEEETPPQNLECVREKSPLGTEATKEQALLERCRMGADITALPYEDEEDKGARTEATVASEEKLPAAGSQETTGARGTRKRRPARPAQEDGSEPIKINANIEQKGRRTRAGTNSQKSTSKAAAAVPSSEESEMGPERTRKGSASSKASQESLDFVHTTPSRSSQRSRLTVAVSENDIPSKRDKRSKSSSHESSEKQDQDLAPSSQESSAGGRRFRKQSTVSSSEGKAEDSDAVAPQEGSTPRRTCRALGIGNSPAANRDPAVPKVMFTGVIDEDGEQVVRKLGGELADSVYECTHLVTDRVRRTVKLLCALARGIPIVTLDWLRKCGRSDCFLSPSGFLVKDAEQERNFGFSLSMSLQRARRGRLFEGYEIHVTPNVKPEPEYMKDIIQCSGATFLPNMPRTYKEKRIVISCPEDLAKCKPAFNAALPVANTEFMLTGILQQVIDLQAYALEAAAEAQESSGKRSSKRSALNIDTAATITDTKSKRRR